jgi:hypothetical protein
MPEKAKHETTQQTRQDKDTTLHDTARHKKLPEKCPLTEAPLQIAISGQVTVATKLTDDAIADASVAIAENVADNLNIPKGYVKAVMNKTASSTRHLLNVVYDIEITISIPATESAKILDENNNIKQLSNPANSGTAANDFKGWLGTTTQLMAANNNADVEVSVEVKVVHVPPTKAPTKSPTKKPTKEPTKKPTKKPTLSPTQAPLQITITAKVAFATELTDDVIANVSSAMADKVADDLDVLKDYVQAVMTKVASGVRRLLNFEYIANITISIPATEVAEIAEKNDGITQLSNPANSGTAAADTIASGLSSLQELTAANGGVPVEVSVEVEVVNVPSTKAATKTPSNIPTALPSWGPSNFPTFSPTGNPTYSSNIPTALPSWGPSNFPTFSPTGNPTKRSTTSSTLALTIAPTYGLNLNIITASNVIGSLQYAALYDTDWHLRDSDSPFENYEMRYHWMTRSNTFGNYIVRDQNSKVFPTAHPPITDGFGTWTVTVSTDARDSDGVLPSVPVSNVICQQEAVTKILASASGENHPSISTCPAANDKSMVYGTPIGVLSFNDFVYTFDFCPAGLRGDRDYRVWFSPIDKEGNITKCPFLCDATSSYRVRSISTPAIDLLFCQP